MSGAENFIAGLCAIACLGTVVVFVAMVWLAIALSLAPPDLSVSWCTSPGVCTWPVFYR